MSLRYGFCFIHVGKVAGTAIRNSLSEKLGIHHFKSPGYFGPLKGTSGTRAIDYERALGPETFDQLFSFAFVRNPWDRILSWYFYDDFGINDFSSWQEAFFSKGGMTQMDYLKSSSGEIAVDFIGRYENLQADWRRVCTCIHAPPFTLPIINASSKQQNRQQYTSEQRDWVQKNFAEEISYFSYTFSD